MQRIQHLFKTLRRGLVYPFLITLGLMSAGAVVAWTGPLNAPPTCTTGNPGCDAPLNVSATAQGKLGNLGIGTASPDKLLTVSGAVPSVGGALSVIRTTGSSNGNALLLDAVGTGNANLGFSVAGVNKGTIGYDVSRNFLGFLNFGYTGADFALRLNSDGSLTYVDAPSGSERFRVNANGSVGINQPSPSRTLDIKQTSDGVGGGLGISNTAATSRINLFVDAANTSYIYASGSGERTLVLNNTGYVGIGTASPAQKLDVNGGLALSGPLQTINGITPQNGAIRVTSNFHINSGNGNAVYLNYDNGSHNNAVELWVCNGVGGCPFRVDSQGTVTANAFNTNSGAQYAYNGDIYMPWAGSWASSYFCNRNGGNCPAAATGVAFGGMFEINQYGQCAHGNPKAGGGCGCPSGTSAQGQMFSVVDGNGFSHILYMCTN